MATMDNKQRIQQSPKGGIEIVFPYDPDIVASIKRVPSARFDRDRKTWYLWKPSAKDIDDLNNFVKENAFVITEKAQALISKYKSKPIEDTKQTNETEATRQENLESSKARNADIEVQGLGGTLRPFQKAGVAYALKNKRSFIADEMGLGKTVQALATVQKADAFPVLVVCPASLKLNWQREAEKWLPGKKISVLYDGTQGEVNNKDVLILNYDILKNWQDDLEKVPYKSIILDESHYCKNYKAQRTEIVKDLAKKAEYRLALTGTPVLNRPQELLSQLGILGRLEDMGGFWYFAKRYCDAKKTRYGWDMTGAANLQELNDKLRSCCYIRREKKDVLTELPEKTRVIVPLEIDNRAEYIKADKDLINYISEKAKEDKKFTESLKGLSEEEKEKRKTMRASDAAHKARQAEELVKIENLKQLSAKGKLKSVKEWVNSFLETGEKLVIFANHRSVVDDLAEAFNAPRITGDTPVEVRQKAVDDFQKDPNKKLLVANIQAGGVGLTLTAASNVAFVEQGWNPGVHDQAEDRVHRIGQKNAVTAYYLLGENTIDEKINSLIEQKRKVVNTSTKGDGGEESDREGILTQLVKSYSESENNKVSADESVLIKPAVPEAQPVVPPRVETVKETTGGSSGLQAFQNSRSPLSKAQDNAKLHKKVISPDSKQTGRWKRDPGAFDVNGIDTPGGKHVTVTFTTEKVSLKTGGGKLPKGRPPKSGKGHSMGGGVVRDRRGQHIKM